MVSIGIFLLSYFTIDYWLFKIEGIFWSMKMQTYGASWALTDSERNVFNTGDGIIPGKSVSRLAAHLHHCSYYHREGAGCCHAGYSSW